MARVPFALKDAGCLHLWEKATLPTKEARLREDKRLRLIRAMRSAQPKYRISRSLSTMVSRKLSKGKGGTSWRSLVGYSLEDLISHLKKKFLPGMTFDNYGEWHVDHIVPVSAFNFTTPSDLDFKRCWSLENLQPLWAKDNLKKGGKIARPFQPSLGF